MKKYIIKENDANQTIFNFIKKVYQNTPLSVIYKWFRKKDIKLNNQRINDLKIILKPNDEVIVYDSNEAVVRDQFHPVSYKDLKIVYEDQNILVVDKQPNLEVHSDYNISLDQIVKSYLFAKKEYNPQDSQSFMVSHIHRLDKLTSGLIIYAKNKVSATILLDAIQDKDKIEKKYLALVEKGFPQRAKANGYIYYNSDEQISIFDERNSHKFMKPSRTSFKKLEDWNEFSLIEATLETGRKHQIRASLKYLRFPIVNDFRYGGKKINQEKQIYLKAYKIMFRHLDFPLSYLNETIIEIPNDFY